MKIVLNIGNLHGVASTRPSKKLVIGLIEEVSIGEAMAEANARVAVIVLSIVCGEKLIVSGSASTKEGILQANQILCPTSDPSRPFEIVKYFFILDILPTFFLK